MPSLQVSELFERCPDKLILVRLYVVCRDQASDERRWDLVAKVGPKIAARAVLPGL